MSERERRVPWAAAYGSGLAAVAVGRLALAQHESPGVLFYYVAPIALVGGAIALGVGIALLERVWRPVAAAGVTAIAAALAASPGTSDGEHVFAFTAAGAAFAIYALVTAVGVRRDATANPTARTLALAVIAVSALAILAAVALFVIVLLLILFYEGEG